MAESGKGVAPVLPCSVSDARDAHIAMAENPICVARAACSSHHAIVGFRCQGICRHARAQREPSVVATLRALAFGRCRSEPRAHAGGN